MSRFLRDGSVLRRVPGEFGQLLPGCAICWFRVIGCFSCREAVQRLGKEITEGE